MWHILFHALSTSLLHQMVLIHEIQNDCVHSAAYMRMCWKLWYMWNRSVKLHRHAQRVLSFILLYLNKLFSSFPISWVGYSLFKHQRLSRIKTSRWWVHTGLRLNWNHDQTMNMTTTPPKISSVFMKLFNHDDALMKILRVYIMKAFV